MFHPAPSSIKSAEFGFTLIEILVVITITGLILGSAIAGYTRFQERQAVFQSGHTLAAALRNAQKKATSGEKPSGCTTLRGYSVVGTATQNTYTLNAVCVNNTYLDTTYTMGTGVTLYQNINVMYQALTGVVIQPSTPAMSSGYVDIYVGNSPTGYASLRVRESGSFFVPCAKLMTTPPTCPP